MGYRALMTWWTWLLLWAALVLGAAAVLCLLGRRLWRQAKDLTKELRKATERVGSLPVTPTRPHREPWQP
jgi:hypothetical protein